VSKKFNIILFVLLIILIAMPFFAVPQGDDSFVYISGMSILPGLDFLDSSSSYISAVRSEFENPKYYLFVIIPIIEIILMCVSIHFEKSPDKKNLSLLLEILCYVMNFIGFVFAVFSLNESPNLSDYELSFGYLGMLFVYVLVYAIKILDYLIMKTPPESELWPNTTVNSKRR